MNLEYIEISQTEKNKYYTESFICRILKSKLIKAENKMVITRQWGWEERTDVEGTNLQQVIN